VSLINQNRSRRVFGTAQIARQRLGDTGRCNKPFPTAACHAAELGIMQFRVSQNEFSAGDRRVVANPSERLPSLGVGQLSLISVAGLTVACSFSVA
jgi:hypothetical protein